MKSIRAILKVCEMQLPWTVNKIVQCVYCAAWILFQVRPQQPNTAFHSYPFVCIEAFGKYGRNKQKKKLCVFTAKAEKNLIIKNRNASKTTEFFFYWKGTTPPKVWKRIHTHVYNTSTYSIQCDMFTFL